jgi:hypothetical protein
MTFIESRIDDPNGWNIVYGHWTDRDDAIFEVVRKINNKEGFAWQTN